MSLGYQTLTVPLFQWQNPQFRISYATDKVWETQVCDRVSILSCWTCIDNETIPIAFWTPCPHTMSLGYQTLTVPLFQWQNPQFRISYATDKVWETQVCDRVSILSCWTCIDNETIPIAFWTPCPHTMSLGYQTLTVPLFQCLHPQFRIL